jgi:hypothetical protein
MTDDIYTVLLKQGFLNREVDLEERKKYRTKEKNRLRVMKKILYKDISSDKEDEDLTLTSTQICNNTFVDSNIKTKDNTSYINYLKEKYEIELSEYKYISNENIDELITGGYVRYVNMNEELKWGGILVKKVSQKKLSRMKLVLKNTGNNYWNIKYKNFYIFYRKNFSKYDKFKDLFISKAHLEF